MVKRKWLAGLLSILLVASLALAGCGSTENAQQPGNQSSGGDAKPSEPQVLNLNINRSRRLCFRPRRRTPRRVSCSSTSWKA
ncbi:hypothetical protein [Calditerricola satsumensis]|uniref:hypothetical protein n=1 Tax=Calditerricola satsumensis TaxID=373054 RepID=UPI00277D0AA4|nr:hypothetical protein [Calditerricola satsumensis]